MTTRQRIEPMLQEQELWSLEEDRANTQQAQQLIVIDCQAITPTTQGRPAYNLTGRPIRAEQPMANTRSAGKTNNAPKKRKTTTGDGLVKAALIVTFGPYLPVIIVTCIVLYVAYWK